MAEQLARAATVAPPAWGAVVVAGDSVAEVAAAAAAHGVAAAVDADANSASRKEKRR